MTYQIQYKKYRRRFREPLQTGAQRITYREGIILKLRDAEGELGFGEVAPIRGFSLETLADAENWLQQLGEKWEGNPVPEQLPCCGFAISGALRWLSGGFDIGETIALETASLLPAGAGALDESSRKLREGFRTFKWKVGVKNLHTEQEIACELANSGNLRLDANGSFSKDELKQWCQFISENENIEFIEQPLPPGHWQAAQAIAEQMNQANKVALDEEVTTVSQIAKIQNAGFKGKLVMKSALAGWISEIPDQNLIHSSALETAIGKETALRLALESQNCLGFGVGELFEDDGLDLHDTGPLIQVGQVGIQVMEEIWERIGNY